MSESNVNQEARRAKTFPPHTKFLSSLSLPYWYRVLHRIDVSSQALQKHVVKTADIIGDQGDIMRNDLNHLSKFALTNHDSL